MSAPARAKRGVAAANSGGADAFLAWLSSAAAHRLLAAERAPLQSAVRRFHGDAVLWVGAMPAMLETTTRCMVRERIFASWCGANGGDGETEHGTAPQNIGCDFKAVRARPTQLPLPSASVDGIVLHHALETVDDRRSALREAGRVLRPGGRLLLLAINPASLWLLAKPHRAFRGVRPLSVPRLYDWLALLGLERDAKTVYLNYRSVLPLAMKGATWQRLSHWFNERQLPVGGVFLIAATKVRHGYITPVPSLQEWRTNTQAGAVAPVAGAADAAASAASAVVVPFELSERGSARR